MIKSNFIINSLCFFLFLFLLLFSLNAQNANELLIYADEIFYDKNENLVGKGKAKILYQNQIINSELIIYNKVSKKLIIPKTFTYKDNQNNLFYGTEGTFNTDFTNGSIKDVKILLNDGSRIVGNKFERENS